MDLERILSVAVKGGASDIILKVGSLPRFRYQGQLVGLNNSDPVTDQMFRSWLDTIVPKHLKAKLIGIDDLDFAFENSQGSRFRANVFRQRQSFGMVLRVINSHVRTLEELQAPDAISNLTNLKRGLVLVTGATGSGKSTTLAAMIERMNSVKPVHIVTVEDPIEFIFQEKMATVNQREIGIDAESFATAMRSALRQNPDVILVGELRDKETTETALMAAETGHLVLSTLHTADAVESITRLMSYFPPHQHTSLRLMLSQSLRAVVSQRLVNRADRKGLVAAHEILISSDAVGAMIREGKNHMISNHMQSQKQDGNVLLNEALLKLVRENIVDPEEAYRKAVDKNSLLEMFKRANVKYA